MILRQAQEPISFDINRIIFAKHLELIQDCSTPHRISEASVATAATHPAPNQVLHFDMPTSAPAPLQHEVTPASTVDTSIFQSARALLKSAINSMNLKATNSKSNDDDSTFKRAARPDHTPEPSEASSHSYACRSLTKQHQTGATTILIGNKLFPLPSPACWALAMELHQILKPIANHITMVQQLQLARQLTHLKVITATRGLQINRNTFTATTSVRELIDRLYMEPHAMISIINGWHRASFRAMEQRLKRLLQLIGPTDSKPKTSPVTEIQDTPPRINSTQSDDHK